MVKVLPLVGYKSLKALNGFHALLLGLKMLPAYIHMDYEAFHASFIELTEEQKETRLREAVAFVELKEDEVEAILSFTKDKNGIARTGINTKKIPLEEVFEAIVAVCMEIGRIKIDIVTETEKKNSLTSASTSGELL